MSRVIDFFGYRGVVAGPIGVHGRHGSDHGLVVGEFTLGRDTFRIGLWNMLRDRPQVAAAATAGKLLGILKLDALLLVESGDYIEELRTLPGVKLIGSKAFHGQGNTSILVPATVPTSHVTYAQMTRRGWITTGGRETDPKYLPSVVLDGRLRVAAGHWPPTVHPRKRKPRVLAGPPRRLLAYAQHSRRVVAFARRHRDLPLVIGADWNNTPTASARYAPRWTAQAAGLRISAPRVGTHA